MIWKQVFVKNKTEMQYMIKTNATKIRIKMSGKYKELHVVP